jgi:predicted RNA-binding Zn ribbon-like protein
VVTRTIENIEFWANDLALDFANTREGTHADPERKDHLHAYADLVTWARRAGVLPRSVRPDGQLGRARELRSAIYDVFAAVAAGDRPPRRALGALLRVHADAVREGTIEDGDWRWTGRHPDRPLWPIAVAAVDLLRSDRLGRLKMCGNCNWLFIDRSRNGSRRWCSMDECGAHTKMRRYRAARRGG